MTTATASRADLEQQGRAIVEQLGGKWLRASGMCRCPAHNDSSPSLSVRIGDRSLFFHCFSGCDTLDVLRALRRGGQLGREGVLNTDDAPAPKQGNLQPVIDRLWSSARGIAGTAAADYLASRGLVSHSAQLKFHARVQLGPKGEATFHRALLAAVRDDSGVIAIHRTFLDPVQPTKASFDNPKRLLGLPGQGAVRLGQAQTVLGLAEGVETAIAASLIHGIPVWAVLGNERFGMITVPAHVRKLVILADNDAGGQRAAELARDGLQRAGLELTELWPPAAHNDWADVIAARRGKGAGRD